MGGGRSRNSEPVYDLAQSWLPPQSWNSCLPSPAGTSPRLQVEGARHEGEPSPCGLCSLAGVYRGYEDGQTPLALTSLPAFKPSGHGQERTREETKAKLVWRHSGPPSLSRSVQGPLCLTSCPLVPATHGQRPNVFRLCLGYLCILINKSRLLVMNVFLIHMNCPVCGGIVRTLFHSCVLFKTRAHRSVCTQFMAVQLSASGGRPGYACPPSSWYRPWLVPRRLGQPLRDSSFREAELGVGQVLF